MFATHPIRTFITREAGETRSNYRKRREAEIEALGLNDFAEIEETTLPGNLLRDIHGDLHYFGFCPQASIETRFRPRNEGRGFWHSQ